jgi:hypothetical protein
VLICPEEMEQDLMVKVREPEEAWEEGVDLEGWVEIDPVQVQLVVVYVLPVVQKLLIKQVCPVQL